MSKETENAFDFEDLGRKVKELRIKNGLTQNQVASELHVTPGYISNVENNRTAMSLRVLSYYAKLTGITLDSLVGTIEPEYRTTALDNELLSVISKYSDQKKQKLLDILKIIDEEDGAIWPDVAFTHSNSHVSANSRPKAAAVFRRLLLLISCILFFHLPAYSSCFLTISSAADSICFLSSYSSFTYRFFRFFRFLPSSRSKRHRRK